MCVKESERVRNEERLLFHNICVCVCVLALKKQTGSGCLFITYVMRRLHIQGFTSTPTTLTFTDDVQLIFLDLRYLQILACLINDCLKKLHHRTETEQFQMIVIFGINA